jgi:hypothetical protein
MGFELKPNETLEDCMKRFCEEKGKDDRDLKGISYIGIVTE